MLPSIDWVCMIDWSHATYYSSLRVSKLIVCVRKPLCAWCVGDELVAEGVPGVAHDAVVVAVVLLV